MDAHGTCSWVTSGMSIEPPALRSASRPAARSGSLCLAIVRECPYRGNTGALPKSCTSGSGGAFARSASSGVDAVGSAAQSASESAARTAPIACTYCFEEQAASSRTASRRCSQVEMRAAAARARTRFLSSVASGPARSARWQEVRQRQTGGAQRGRKTRFNRTCAHCPAKLISVGTTHYRSVAAPALTSAGSQRL